MAMGYGHAYALDRYLKPPNRIMRYTKLLSPSPTVAIYKRGGGGVFTLVLVSASVLLTLSTVERLGH